METRQSPQKVLHIHCQHKYAKFSNYDVLRSQNAICGNEAESTEGVTHALQTQVREMSKYDIFLSQRTLYVETRQSP